MHTRRELSRALRSDERGQMAITMVLSLVVVVMFFSLAFDAGTWYFDHRNAQNEADAAALAAAGILPADSTTIATKADAAVSLSLSKNGLSCASPGCLHIASGGPAPTCTGVGECVTVLFQDTMFSDGLYDRVSVLVRRPSPIVFAALTGASNIWISASSAATAGPADLSNVMPWAIVAPPGCSTVACNYDANSDGDFSDPGECSTASTTCAFGLNRDRVYAFPDASGRTAIIGTCETSPLQGDADYSSCLEGALSSPALASGQTVTVGANPVATPTQTLKERTNRGLKKRFGQEVGWTSASVTPPWDSSFDAAWTASQCNQPISPTDTTTGYDVVGRAAAVQRYAVAPPLSYCQRRVVVVPIIEALPAGPGWSMHVLGLATFAIARWDYESVPAMEAPGGGDCQGAALPPTFQCGLVWGYLLGTDARAPAFATQKIGTNPNPLAPTLIALSE